MKVVLCLGSNVGQRKRRLKQAADLITQYAGRVLSVSSIYETEPWGKTDQPLFLNQVLVIKTDLQPEELLGQLQKIEQKLGRKKHLRWAERSIDIDILFYESVIYESETLTVPHPHLHERNFVLIPLLEIIPEFIHPKLKLNIEELYIRCLDQNEVVLHSKT